MTTATATKARRLTAASARNSYDPFVEIDWDHPLDDSAYHLPPEFLPLYGTAQWDAMSENERRAYSRHECASLCGAGIWFENILMHLVLRHLYDLPADDPVHRYLLVETADECRHSAMFGEYIRRAGTPSYRPPTALRAAGKFMKLTASKASGYIAILAAEELLDVSNRATMSGDGIHPTSAHIARIHVAEEARHVSFARTWLSESWASLPWWSRLRAMVVAPVYVAGIAESLVNPAVYDELGIEDGAAAARHNPNHRRRVARDLGKLTGFLTDLGVITSWSRPIWRALGLLERGQ